jgi:hypothetical protein
MRFEFDVNLKRPIERPKKKDIRREPALRKSLVLAYQIQDLLDRGKAGSYNQIARWLNFQTSRITQIMNLLFLSPEIQEEILTSDNLAVLGLTEYNVRHVTAEVDWKKQIKLWRSIV